MPPQPPKQPLDLPTLLRRITLASFIPALAFVIPYATETHRFFPALGLIPLAVGCAYSALVLAGNTEVAMRYAQYGNLRNVAIDGICAVGLIVCLIVGWVGLSRGYHRGTQISIVGTYGTVPLMLNFCIHTYFAVLEFRPLPHINNLAEFKLRFFGCEYCEHCQTERLAGRGQGAAEEAEDGEEGGERQVLLEQA